VQSEEEQDHPMICLEIPDDLAKAAKATPDELKTELAIHLYEQGRLSIEQAYLMSGASSLGEFHSVLLRRAEMELDELPDAEELAHLKGLCGRLEEGSQVMRALALEHMSSTFIRTPLSSVIGYANVILKGLDGPVSQQQREDLTTIRKSAEGLLEYVGEFLDVVPYVFRDVELYVTDTDLTTVIERATSAQLKQTKLKVAQDISKDLPMIRADESRVCRALVGMLRFAKQVHPDGQGRLTITASHTDKEVTIAVTTNEGWPVRRVGNPMLFMVQSIARLHQGEAFIEKRNGKEWRVALTLPLHHQAIAEDG
jgi:signal transduction histidine kinase